MVRSIGRGAVLLLPALVVRLGGWHPTPVVALLLYGAAVVAASFLLAWAAEAAQVDISGGLAIAVLALIAVLPEYAVDLYYAYTAGHDPTYVQYAAANMTGSNRLLLGLGWPVVTLLALAAAKRLRRGSGRALELDRANRMELGFLLVAGVIAFASPAAAVLLSGAVSVSGTLLFVSSPAALGRGSRAPRKGRCWHSAFTMRRRRSISNLGRATLA